MRVTLFFILLLSCNDSYVNSDGKQVKIRKEITQRELQTFLIIEDQTLDQLELSTIAVKALLDRKLNEQSSALIDQYLSLDCIEGICNIFKKDNL
mgnify:CR=1 FL=1